MSDGLPRGWMSASTREVVEDLQPGFACGDKNVPDGVAHLRMNNIGLEGELVLDLIRTVPPSLAKPQHDIHRGDVLVCTTNSGKLVGKCAYFDLPGRYTFSNHITRLRPRSSIIDGRFLRWSLWLEWQQGTYDDKCKHWVNQSSLPKDALLDTCIVFPPLDEQHRIVAKLDALLGKVDTCQQRLAKVPFILKRFRQSVLAAACSGRLTADWREGDIYEDELPTGWIRVPLEDLLPQGGIFDGPFGSNLKSSDYCPSGVRVVRLENVGHLRFIGEKETFISREKYSSLRKHTVREGDIIFASFIDEEIRACILPRLKTPAIAKADCYCIRPLEQRVDRKYLTLQLVSRESYDALFSSIHGATRPRINTSQLKQVMVRICPLPEQHEIVRRIEDLFAVADQVEARYAKAKAHVDRLTQSILAKAFRGELVPQNPDDEPASVMLARVMTERAGTAARSQRRRRRRRS